VESTIVYCFITPKFFLVVTSITFLGVVSIKLVSFFYISPFVNRSADANAYQYVRKSGVSKILSWYVSRLKKKVILNALLLTNTLSWGFLHAQKVVIMLTETTAMKNTTIVKHVIMSFLLPKSPSYFTASQLTEVSLSLFQIISHVSIITKSNLSNLNQVYRKVY